MSITVSWYNEMHSILHVVAHGGQSWDDFKAAAQQAADEIAEIGYSVDVIFESSSMRVPPGNPMRNLKAAYLQLTASARGGAVVIVPPLNDDCDMAQMGEIVLRMFRLTLANHTGFVYSVEEGYARIQARRDQTEFAA